MDNNKSRTNNVSSDGFSYRENNPAAPASRTPLSRRPEPPTEAPPLEQRHIRGRKPVYPQPTEPKEPATRPKGKPRPEGRRSSPVEKAKSNDAVAPLASTAVVGAPTAHKGNLMERLRYRPFNKEAVRPGDIVRERGGVDRGLFVLVCLLLMLGTVMVSTASYAEALSRHGDSYRFIRPQLTFVALGLAVMFIIMHLDYRIFKTFALPIFGVSVVLLIAVLIFGLARGAAVRWLNLGFIQFQPSEVMKLGIVVFLASYYHNYTKRVNSKKFWESSAYGVFIPAFVLGVVCVLIMMQNHFSGTIIMMFIGVFVIWGSGARKFWLITASVTALVAIVLIIFTVPYARVRVDAWLFPENFDITAELWQSHQGRLAIGSGGLFGVGIGNSRQKHMFVPEPHNDFIFTIIAEELGFVGSILILGLYLAFIWRGFTIARKAPDTFSSLLVYGIISKVAIQTLLNIAVVTGVAPNTGVSLPFASFGGSALVMLLAEMGIVLSVSRYSYQHK